MKFSLQNENDELKSLIESQQQEEEQFRPLLITTLICLCNKTGNTQEL